MLELFRGPTSAFKDVALSMLPQCSPPRRPPGVGKGYPILTATFRRHHGKAAL